ncbi:MAG: hypothetical protein ACHQAY_05345 [Hyphomicrobiales bacterium]
MGLISELFGALAGTSQSAKARTIPQIEAALVRLGEERKTANAALLAASAERKQAILQDAADEEITALDVAADKHRLALERCELAEPQLLLELEGARSEARRILWEGAKARHADAVAKFRLAYRGAIEAFETVAALNGEARGAGFAVEADHALIVPPRVLDRAALNNFEEELDRRRDAAAEKRSASPAAISPKALPPAKRAEKRAAPPAAPKPRPREPIIETGGDGFVRVAIIRSGFYRDGDGRQYGPGDILALRREQADKALRGGAVTEVSP